MLAHCLKGDGRTPWAESARLAAGSVWCGGGPAAFDPMAFAVWPHGKPTSLFGVLTTASAFEPPEMLSLWR